MIYIWKVTAKSRKRQRTDKMRARTAYGAMAAFKRKHHFLWEDPGRVQSIEASRIGVA